ncbi:hypothetical protein CXF72_15640 [Psychromonas sp. MB-3u-54]|uniref:tetratricopeptide repeat protein n=1 Tax=Psychromonas sp. MB-3u-54 TaxID=2058319 RepID=UPI000C32D568|nr:hypothetical protein [Psychromonas sp. MB-3u-54]PKH01677.1 hypothetical protein CXF72_15640 [Psychromonas sp. MB-3u-54]
MQITIRSLLSSAQTAKLAAAALLISTYLPAGYANNMTAKPEQNMLQREALFYYHQGDYQHALTTLEHAKLKGEKLNVKTSLLHAGLVVHFDFNSDDNTGKLFERYFKQQSAAKHLPAAEHDYVFFVLMQGFYQQGNLEKAQQAHDMIGDHLLPKYSDQFYYLSGELAIALDNDKQLTMAKQHISPGSVKHRYLAFNHAMKALEQQDTETALALLSVSAVTEQKDLEGLAYRGNMHINALSFTDSLNAIIDRAYLAKAYIYSDLKDYDEAMASFRQVTLNSLDTESAMLGMGKVAYYQNDLNSALAVWQQLAQRDSASGYVNQGYVLSAYALERLGKPQQAYAAYQNALQHFTDAQRLLTAELARVDQPDYLSSLLENSSKNFLDVGKVTLNLPESIDDYAQIASPEFQRRLTALKQTEGLHLQLAAWQRQLLALAQRYYTEPSITLETLPTSETKLAEKLLGREKNKLQDIDNSLNRLTRQLMGSYFSQDSLGGEQKALLSAYKRYQTLEAALKTIDVNHKDYSLLRARLNRVAGGLIWHIGDYYLTSEMLATKNALLAQQQYVLELENRDAQLLTKQLAKIDQQLEQAEKHSQTVITRITERFEGLLASQLDDVEDYITHSELAMVRLRDSRNTDKSAVVAKLNEKVLP